MCFMYCRPMAADISGIRLSQSFDLANSANCLLCVRSIPPSPPDVTILEPERETMRSGSVLSHFAPRDCAESIHSNSNTSLGDTLPNVSTGQSKSFDH